jgi:hypothetical protein
MRTISVAVSEPDYEAFRRAAGSQGRPIAELIREAMALYRTERIEPRTRLTDLPVFLGRQAVSELPHRAEIYDEIFAAREPSGS